MSLKHRSFTEQSITHLTLVAGCLLFSFPFVWMLCTSVKTTSEMSSDRLRFLPVAPRPQAVTPYVGEDEYLAPKPPEDIPDAVWEQAQPIIEQQLTAMLSAWEPKTEGPDDNPPPAPLDPEVFRSEMTEGLFKMLGAHISDEARGTALEAEKAARRQSDPEALLPHDSVILNTLGDAAIQAGVDALAGEAKQLVTEERLRRAFDDCYRRFSLGQVRLRTRDYAFYTLPSDGWRVVKGSAELVGRIKQTVPSQEARITFSPDANTASFEFEMELADLGSDEGGLNSADLDRVYVGFRSDASWARIVFEAIRDGQRYRAESPYSLSLSTTTEQELRFEPDPDTMKRRAYYLLEPVGPAPEGSPAFALQAHVTRSSAAGAWFDKITSNYRQTFREVNFLRYISTSFALTILNIVLAIFSCTLVAYAFARLPWPGRNLFFGILMATMMIPPQVTMIPAFLVHKYLGWYNTLLPMWVGSLFGAPFFVFLLRQFFKNVPRDLEEAARIDGCGFLRVYWHVMLPLVKPTVATIAIFTFMGTWNNFMGPLIYVNDERLFPLALGLFKFSLGGGSDVGQMMAGAFIMTLPIIILFFFAQRYFIQGISLTGTKG